MLTCVLSHHACAADRWTTGSCAVAAAIAAPAATTAAACLVQLAPAALAELCCKANPSEKFSRSVWLKFDQHAQTIGSTEGVRADAFAEDRAPVKMPWALTPLMPKEDAPAACTLTPEAMTLCSCTRAFASQQVAHYTYANCSQRDLDFIQQEDASPLQSIAMCLSILGTPDASQ